MRSFRGRIPFIGVAEYLIRRTLGLPMSFAWVGDGEGVEVGDVLKTQAFPPVSAVRDEIPYLIAAAMTRAVLLDGLRANGFRTYCTETRDDGWHQACFQPVYISNLTTAR